MVNQKASLVLRCAALINPKANLVLITHLNHPLATPLLMSKKTREREVDHHLHNDLVLHHQLPLAPQSDT
jgi:hypothetical protein